MKNDLVDRLIADWREQMPELDASAMGVVGRILRLGRQLESRIGVVLRDYELHYTDLDVLATLRRIGPPFTMTPTELRRSVLITSGAMTAALDRLEAKALILRQVGDSDRRVKSARLTPAGKALTETAIAARFDEAKDSIAALSPEERQELADLLRKLALALDEANPDTASGTNAVVTARASAQRT